MWLLRNRKSIKGSAKDPLILNAPEDLKNKLPLFYERRELGDLSEDETEYFNKTHSFLFSNKKDFVLFADGMCNHKIIVNCEVEEQEN